MPISSDQFDAGKTVDKVALDEVMTDGQGYTTPEVSDLIGMSWGIAKKQLLAAEEDGYVLQKKVGRKIFWRYYPDGVPEELKAEAEEE